MLRKTLVSLAVTGALYASSGYALELGELTSQSSLDEPYRGKIEISDVGTLTTNDILIRLGSESEFRQAGFSQTRVLSQLKFDVVRDDGNLVVAVTSDEPLDLVADELHFILAARWPSGQVVREYQAPLNQSALVEKAKKEVVQSASVSTGSTAPKPSGAVFREATFQAEAMSPKSNLNVVKGNTLWSIAGESRPNNQLTIYQTMMAIQALNKDAFYSDNINLLKEGAILRLPTQDQITLFNRTTSEEEFQRQHEAWVALKGTQGNTSVGQAQLNTQAKSKAAAPKTDAAADKLTLSSGQSLLPENVASSNVGVGNATVTALQAELSASQEMLDKEQREKGDLSGQLSDLNEQLATLENLISLKDEQLAELMRQFASAQQSLQEQKNTVDQLLEADQIRREKEQMKADSLMNKIFGNPIVVSIGAVLLLLLGLFVGLMMRRNGKKQAEPESLTKDEFDLSSAAAPVVATAAVMDEDFEEDEDDVLEDDPFAFDFDTPETNDSTEEFDSFDSDIESIDESDLADDSDFFDSTDLSDEVEEDFSESPETELESALEEETDEEILSSFDETDDLPDLTESFSQDDDFDGVSEDDIPTMEPEIDEPIEGASDSDVDDIIDSEEESFVSSLLDDSEQEDVDESSMFTGVSDDSIADSIEETLAEAAVEEDVDVPAFGEAEAAEDEEVSDEEEEFDFFDASGDEVATKLDLARAYMDMGDEEGARVILEDVVDSGNEKQIAEAQSMMERMFPSD